MKNKCCTKCGQIKPLTDFYRRNDYKNTPYPKCKICHVKNNKICLKEYYRKNKSKLQKERGDYRQKNKLKIKERDKKYYQKNKLRILNSQNKRNKKYPKTPEGKLAAKRYRQSEKGRLANKRRLAKRQRNLGYISFEIIPLSVWKFVGITRCDGHHYTDNLITPIPYELHKNNLGNTHRQLIAEIIRIPTIGGQNGKQNK